ncbi:50S ribosomal protein L2, partial [Candidatus Kaiserbacteria bacterium]|nr:50S ribosomal protein L2 [Candidatus Kaiserbacteria bacterium]
MSIRAYKPRTAGTRGMTTLNYREMLSGHKPTKSLTHGAKSRGGRNSQGRITVRHQGGGHKRSFRDVDFKFNKKDIPAKIASIEYDPFRSAFIGIAVYRDGEKRYI